MWPNAKICVMGPDQLSSVMHSVGSKKQPSPSASTLTSTSEEGGVGGDGGAEERRKILRDKIEIQSSALYSTARIWVS